MTVLVTTHYMDEAEQCARLVLILDGQLVANGTPAEIKASLPAGCSRSCRRAIRSSRDDGRGRPGRRGCLPAGVALRAVAVPGGLEAMRPALAQVGTVAAAEPTLEDAFVTLVREHRGPRDADKEGRR
jgi:ABC-2 type transport system ATP-binding protein